MTYFYLHGVKLICLTMYIVCIVDIVCIQTHLTTFAEGEPYKTGQYELNRTFHVANITSHNQWSMARLMNTNWYRQYHHVWNVYRSLPKGSNILWAWKPFIILETMRSIPKYDWVYYTDASKYHSNVFSSYFSESIEKLQLLAMNNSGCNCIPAVRLRQSIEWEYAQRCSLKHGHSLCESIKHVSTYANCTQWKNYPMLQASFSLWRNDGSTRIFLKKWLDLVTSVQFMTRLPFDDQSAISLLIHATPGMKALWWPHHSLVAWRESSVLDKRRVYPSGGYVKSPMSVSFFDALKAKSIVMIESQQTLLADWRPLLLKKHLCTHL